MTETVRPTAAAGTFYPADPYSLAAQVDALLDLEPAIECEPIALVVPHAGYMYSGEIAAAAYATLRAVAGSVKRVVLLGPAHRVPVRGLAASSADAFESPLGVVSIDAEAREIALAQPGVAINDEAHRDEHSVEVHLPFLQRVLGEFAVLPLVVGHTPAAMIADVIEATTNSESLVVVSTDLSHYESYDSARSHDRETIGHVIDGRLDRIGPEDACGCFPLRGLMEFARRRNLTLRLVDLRNSGDTAGPRHRVVGYGSLVLAAR